MPDIKVGEHIDRDCRSDPAQRKRKVSSIKEHIYLSEPCAFKLTLFIYCFVRFLQINAPREAASKKK